MLNNRIDGIYQQNKSALAEIFLTPDTYLGMLEVVGQLSDVLKSNAAILRYCY